MTASAARSVTPRSASTAAAKAPSDELRQVRLSGYVDGDDVDTLRRFVRFGTGAMWVEIRDEHGARVFMRRARIVEVKTPDEGEPTLAVQVDAVLQLPRSPKVAS